MKRNIIGIIRNVGVDSFVSQSIVDSIEGGDVKGYTEKLFYFPKDALDFIKNNKDKIAVIVSPLRVDFGDGNLHENGPGGIQLYEELQELDDSSKLFVFDTVRESDVKYHVNLENKNITYYNLGEIDDGLSILESIKELINKK